MRVEQNNSGVNQVQQFSAINVFKNNKNITKPTQEEETVEAHSGVKTGSTPGLLERIDVNEVKECAKYAGEFNITDEDIKYGLLYGRSVIAEWLC